MSTTETRPNMRDAALPPAVEANFSDRFQLGECGITTVARAIVAGLAERGRAVERATTSESDPYGRGPGRSVSKLEFVVAGRDDGASAMRVALTFGDDPLVTVDRGDGEGERRIHLPNPRVPLASLGVLCYRLYEATRPTDPWFAEAS